MIIKYTKLIVWINIIVAAILIGLAIYTKDAITALYSVALMVVTFALYSTSVHLKEMELLHKIMDNENEIMRKYIDEMKRLSHIRSKNDISIKN